MKFIAAGHIEVNGPEWLSEVWPADMPLRNWPTFCGAGDGIGDFVVPDRVRTAIVAPACFIHDIEWATGDIKNPYDFVMSNVHFYFNLRAMCSGQLTGTKLRIALHLCGVYALVVTSPIGWRNYEPCGKDWKTNVIVKDRLKRLARAHLGLTG